MDNFGEYLHEYWTYFKFRVQHLTLQMSMVANPTLVPGDKFFLFISYISAIYINIALIQSFHVRFARDGPQLMSNVANLTENI